MAKILRTLGFVTVVYSDGYTVTQPEQEDGQLFVNAFLYQDDEEELQKYFPRTRKMEKKTDLNKYKEIYEKKKKGG